jgi:hypothetical protein
MQNKCGPEWKAASAQGVLFYCCTVHFEFTEHYTSTNALLFENFTLKHLKARTCFDP